MAPSDGRSAIALPDGPLRKRVRINGKQPSPTPQVAQSRAVTTGPTLTVERSIASPHLAVITLENFADNQLGLAPLASLGSSIRSSMNSAMQQNMLFKVKVDIEWLLRSE